MTDPSPYAPWDPNSQPAQPSQPAVPPQPDYSAQPSYPAQPGYAAQPAYPQPEPYPGAAYPAGGYVAPQAAYYPGYPAYAYPPPAKTNGLAIAAMVCAIAGLATCISAPVGAILGHVARRQIRERGEAGGGMALTGIIVGWILTAGLLAYLAFIGFAIWMAERDGAFDDPYAMVSQALMTLAG